MLFNSWTFVVFFLIVLLLYQLLPQRAQNRMLLVASYVFYGTWDHRFLLLLGFSTLVDYFVGWRLHHAETARHRKAWLWVSCITNLGILGFFKYFNFFVESAVQALRMLGLEVSVVSLGIILPVGISFYTLQELGYVIDIYRGRVKPVENFFDFALFVSFFPQLVAGPIERAGHLIPQLTRKRRVTRDDLAAGCWLLLWGFFKKMVIADNLAIIVDAAFDAPEPVSGAACLIAVYAFTYQIYCDFSGYTDIARGLARLMGINIMLNFDRPYLARNPAEFWRRWHISLSTWLRDYVYIPLGSRGGRSRAYRSLFLTMVLAGVWHGAAWTFVLWGAYFGVLLALHRALIRYRGQARAAIGLRGVLSCIGMFHLTCLGMLIFRSRDVEQIWAFVSTIGSGLAFDGAMTGALAAVTACAAALWIIETWLDNADDPRTRPGWRSGLGPITCSALFAALVVFTPPGGGAFIYFQF